MSGRTQPLGWTDKEVKMAQVSFREIRQAVSLIGDGVLMQPVSREQHDAAMALKVAVRYTHSFKALRGEGQAAAIRFEEIGDYETANMINATIEAAF
jgi:hypothetical protein